jgi:hypothetical protein
MASAHLTAFTTLGNSANAVAGSVDDASDEFPDHREHDRLMPLEITYRACLVRAHQCAIARDVSRENGAKTPFHALFGHFDHTCSRSTSFIVDCAIHAKTFSGFDDRCR